MTEPEKVIAPMATPSAISMRLCGRMRRMVGSAMGVIRSTFVVDSDGTVSMARYNVRAKGHVAMVAKLLEIELPESDPAEG